jgi:hypothetical protein
LTARDPKPPVDAEGPERYTALYDPDTVFPARMEGLVPKPSSSGGAGDEGEPSPQILADGEKRRVKPPMSADLVRRVADRVERRARRK